MKKKYNKEEYKKMKEQEIAQMVSDIEAGVKEIATGEDWKRLLDFQSCFYNYSFRNQFLIWASNPAATYVGGFNFWKKIGRFVKKDETGIRIFAPVKVKIESDNDDQDKFFLRFKAVSVFDVSQTDGDEVPTAPVRVLESETLNRETLSLLSLYAEGLGFAVRFVEQIDQYPGAHGVCNYDKREIKVKQNAIDQQVKTLIHEIAHAVMHFDIGDYDEVHSRAQREIEAESVAYCVSKAIGLDTKDYSFGYVATWSGGKTEEIINSGERIQRCALGLIDHINSERERAAA